MLFVGVCAFMPSEDMGWVFVYWKHHVHISMCPSCVKKVFYLWELCEEGVLFVGAV